MVVALAVMDNQVRRHLILEAQVEDKEIQMDKILEEQEFLVKGTEVEMGVMEFLTQIHTM
jgi:hypothetical protein